MGAGEARDGEGGRGTQEMVKEGGGGVEVSF